MASKLTPGDRLNDFWGRFADAFQWVGQQLASQWALSILTLVATAGSTVAAFFTWEAALTANSVSSASQAFAQKVYNDQIAMGHPSISVLSGEISAVTLDTRQEQQPEFTTTVVLRNSGQRASPRAWVALASESVFGEQTPAILVSLPKDIDVPVRFNLNSQPRTIRGDSAWFAAVIYEDERPTLMTAPGIPSTPAQISLVCSEPKVFRMNTWPKDPSQDLAVRVFSSGSPVVANPNPQDPFERSTASRIKATSDRVLQTARAAGACI
jgi:hypothetical protein